MNAPIPATALDTPEFRIVKIGALRPSPTNPRSRRGFDEASLKELAQTMQPPVGVIEPLVVRVISSKVNAMPDASTEGYAVEKVLKYEIVCGERRWRAAQIAKLDTLPVLVRQLTDFEVLRLQLIENEKRKDLDALEEAEGYEKLMQQKDADGNPYTAETLAKLQGVSKATIYARLKLLALCPDARDAFFAGKIDASTALLIARIPVEKLQMQALKKITEVSGWGNQFLATGDKMSYRKARELLQDEFMLDLDRAPFDTADAALLPKAGNCTACPKRTGNAPDLFDDVGSKDVCTDPVCFGMKKAAHVLKLQKDAEAQGGIVLKGKEAKKLIPNNYNPAEYHLRDHGYATLDTPIPGDAKKRTLGQVLEENNLMKPALLTGKPAVQKTVVANPHREGQMIETVSIEVATKALREAGFEITLKGGTNKQSEPDQSKQREKDAEKLKQKLAIENAFRGRLFDTLHNKIEADMLEPESPTWPILYRKLATSLFDGYSDYSHEDVVALIQRYTTLPKPAEGEEIDWASHIAEFGENIANLTPAQHLMLIAEIPLLMEELTASQYSGDAKNMLSLASELGIDADAMKKEVTAEAQATAKAEALAAKAKAKAAAPATAATPPPAAPKLRPADAWPFPTQTY